MELPIEFIQKELKRAGKYHGNADGKVGPLTRKALEGVKEIPRSWTTRRKLIAYLQIAATAEGIDAGKIDGYWGPQTQFAYETLLTKRTTRELPEPWRPEDKIILNPNNWPSQEKEEDIIAFYGPVGENQVRFIPPYPHVLAWIPGHVISGFNCHEKVEDSLMRVLTNVKDHYGIGKIQALRLDQFGGCLNVRKMRGGTRWSMHSWGIALDYDPENNQLNWGRDKATFAKPEYNRWWEFWEDEGWFSLGRQRNFDWMHVQAARF